jgi:hypothetical protein
MRQTLRRSILSAIAIGIVVVLIAACATSPKMDGGIVGTGNEPDCEARKKKGDTETSLPEECKREAAAAR